jgi:hypothetical protein
MATHSSRRLDALPTRTARQGNRMNGIGVFRAFPRIDQCINQCIE